jgi:hypothetical protein
MYKGMDRQTDRQTERRKKEKDTDTMKLTNVQKDG